MNEGRTRTSAPERTPDSAARRRARWIKTALAAVNLFFGVLLAVWPFVTFFGVIAWNQPVEGGFRRWLLDYASWTTLLYPLVYFAALGLSILFYRRRHPWRALVVASLPVLTAYPWVLILSFFVSVFPVARHVSGH